MDSRPDHQPGAPSIGGGHVTSMGGDHATTDPDARRLTVVLAPNWGPEPRRFVVRWRTARLAAAALALAVVVMAASFASLVHRAATADGVRRERDRLAERYDSMAILAERISALDALASQLRTVSGLEDDRELALWLPGAAGGGAMAEGATGTATDPDTSRAPTLWPLTEPGFVTQSLLDGDEGSRHPGIDIAIPSGSYVRAAGSGTVIEAGADPVYGNFVLLDHGGRLYTRYGHLNYVSVQRGQQVTRGEVMALSGSTGRSTAPHLHFEILMNGRPVDPFDMVTPP